MKKYILSLLSLTVMQFASATRPPVEMDLWETGYINENGLTGTPEQGDPGFVMNVSNPKMYIYPSSKPNGVGVLVFPGGGYAGLAMLHEGSDMAGMFNELGITYAVVKYSMPNGHKDIPLKDAEQSMRLLKKWAHDNGCELSKVGVMGASAGGHLATTAATHYSSDETRPDFQILLYPVVSMKDGLTHEGSRNLLLGKKCSVDDVLDFSNELHVNANTPIAFIALSADDEAVPIENSLLYASALTQNKVGVSMHIFPHGGHGWGFRDKFPYKPAWTNALKVWLNNEVIFRNFVKK